MKNPLGASFAVLLSAWTIFSASAAIRSNFDNGNDGWVQVNIDGDVRYTLPVEGEPETGACQLAAPSLNVLAFKDLDAGGWMFDAPQKFLGNQSSVFGGRLRWRQYWTSCDPWDEQTEPDFRVVIANRNIAVVLKMVIPPQGEWKTNVVRLNESSGWLWVDDNAPQEALVPATNAQIQQALSDVSGLRIMGEFVTGDDLGAIDDVALLSVEDEIPRLEIRWLSGSRLEVSWANTEVSYRLEWTSSLLPSLWTAVTTTAPNRYEFDVGGADCFFRLQTF